MRPLEAIQANVLHLAQPKDGGLGLDQVVSTLVSGIGQLEEEHRALKTRCAELAAALEQAHRQITNLEEAARTNAKSAARLLSALAHSLGWAEEAIDAGQKRSAGGAKRYLETAKRVLELQKEVISLLDKAQDEIARREHDADQRAIEALREARRSVLSTADELSAMPPDPSVRVDLDHLLDNAAKARSTSAG